MTSRKTDVVLILLLVLAAFSACSRNQGMPAVHLDNSLAFQLINHSGSQADSLDKKPLAEFHGNWLMINFWSISCPPCFEEIPDLAKVHTELKNPPVQVIGVAMSHDRPDAVLDTLQKVNIPYPVSFDLDGRIEKAFGNIRAIPSSFLVNPQGQPVKHYTGKVTFRQIQQDVKNLSETYQQKD